jgi:cytochrome c oxidase subunit 1/cytochrome c oxidase subunit I+III
MNEAVTAVAPGDILSPDERQHYRLAWLSTVDHKRIGILYLITALVFFVLGGIEALLIRIQLAVPNSHFLHPDTYNQIYTMHGTTMIFLVAMPAVFGVINYVLPLQIGARDMAFPRLNAFSFWLVPFGGILLHFSILAGGMPNVGWYAYAPLSETPYASQPGVDYWITALLVLGIGSVATAINIIATVLCLRSKGMTLRRLPLFTWINFVNSFIVLAALPVLNAGLVMLLIDRQLDAHFFVPSGGGSAVMWQHIFWAFGHPEVYILALPAFAILSEIVPVFSRKPIFGYEFVAGSSVVIAILSLGVWAHHMFTTGLGRPADLFFGIASMLIAIPTGVKVLNWTATMVGGRLRLDTPMLFCIAAILQFVPAGLTGVSHAMPALDWQTKNSYYLVAHFHFVAVGLIVFALLGAIQYWFPKMSGRMLSERLGKWSFWLMTIGFNMTFIIQHFLGLLGMPRRVYTYPDLPHYTWMNLLSSAGAIFMTVAALILVYNVIVSLIWGKEAAANPWNAWTLEWATPSPPPPENFHRLPPILSRRPLWDLANPDRPDPMVGQPNDVVMRPDKSKVNVLAFIFSEIGFFGILILSYLYYNAQRPPGPGPEELNLFKTSIFSVCLFASSFTIWRSEVALRKQKHGGMIGWLIVTIALGTIFIVGQGIEYWELFEKGVRLSTNLFGSSFFTLTGFHGLHVCLGLIAMLLLLGLAFAGDFRRPGHSSVLEAVGYYWHFVDVVWVLVLTVVYLLPLIR